MLELKCFAFAVVCPCNWRNTCSRFHVVWILSCYVCRGKYLFRPKPGESLMEHRFYHDLFPQIVKEISVRSLVFCYLFFLLIFGVRWSLHKKRVWFCSILFNTTSLFICGLSTNALRSGDWNQLLMLCRHLAFSNVVKFSFLSSTHLASLSCHPFVFYTQEFSVKCGTLCLNYKSLICVHP